MRQLLFIALFLATANAAAGWTKIGESDLYSAYADLESIQRATDSLKMLSLLDYYKELQPDGVRSVVTVDEYDCAGRRLRNLSTTYYSGAMATGTVLLRVDGAARWITPARSSEDSWNAACRPLEIDTEPRGDDPILDPVTWTKYIDDKQTTGYLAESTIQKIGSIRRVWGLIDLRERSESGALSRRVLWEFDCKAERNRILTLVSYAENMARGKVIVKVTTPTSWSDIRPRTIGEAGLRIVCARE